MIIMAEEIQTQEPQLDAQEPEEQATEAAEAVPVEKTAEGEVLPFPRARVVSIMRTEIKDKIIRSEVKEAMNFWIGNLLKRIAKEMNNSMYGSVSIADFQRATKPYDMVEDIVKDQERLIVSCEKLKLDSDAIRREMLRFFATIRGKPLEEENTV